MSFRQYQDGEAAADGIVNAMRRVCLRSNDRGMSGVSWAGTKTNLQIDASDATAACQVTVPRRCRQHHLVERVGCNAVGPALPGAHRNLHRRQSSAHVGECVAMVQEAAVSEQRDRKCNAAGRMSVCACRQNNGAEAEEAR